MSFNVAFIAHAPDANPEKTQCLIQTQMYKLFVRVVQNQEQAVKVCQDLVKKEGIHAILLCPGFTHKNIAELADAVGTKTGIFVARGDSPSNNIVAEVMAREGWFASR